MCQDWDACHGTQACQLETRVQRYSLTVSQALPFTLHSCEKSLQDVFS